MSKVDIIRLAKAIKQKIKKSPPAYISYCRRIERIKTNKRICAMTFDDGPTYESEITRTILDTLNRHNAKGTFDIIGTTENNYPDSPGKLGSPSWSGIAYDHYPKYESDKNAGAVNCPDLIREIIDSGHEITNHTYSHVLFGKKNIIYSKRQTLKSFNEVYDDVSKLHNYMLDNYGYNMKLSRPPHYVDKIKGGLTSYNVYDKMGYNYLAASFDGAGWLPCADENEEIEAMVNPLRRVLEENPDALCGQIIFQKDGYNMSLRAPVKKGLEKQLQVLDEYGYKVVTVSELLNESPFADVGRDDPDFETFNNLVKDYAIAFSNNTLRPDENMTKGELSMLLAPKDISIESFIENTKKNIAQPKLKYESSASWCVLKNYFKDKYSELTMEDIENCEVFFDLKKVNSLKRRTLLKAFKGR